MKALLFLVAWFCCGALALGIVLLESSRRKDMEVSGKWYALAMILGPIFLFFILPQWLGRWGKGSK